LGRKAAYRWTWSSFITIGYEQKLANGTCLLRAACLPRQSITPTPKGILSVMGKAEGASDREYKGETILWVERYGRKTCYRNLN
jgi:hypothetical protein